MLPAARRTVYATLVPRLVLPLHARLSGRTFWPEYRRLQALQWESPATLEARSLGKLRTLVAHAMATCPTTGSGSGDAGVRPETLRTLDDLARLPITRKVELRDGPRDRDDRRQPAGRAATGATVTSGSTGFPFEFYSGRRRAPMGWWPRISCASDWAGTAIWHARIDIGNSRERPMPSAHAVALGACPVGATHAARRAGGGAVRRGPVPGGVHWRGVARSARRGYFVRGIRGLPDPAGPPAAGARGSRCPSVPAR